MVLSAKDYVDGAVTQRHARAAWQAQAASHEAISSVLRSDGATLRVAGGAGPSGVGDASTQSLYATFPVEVELGRPVARLSIAEIDLDEVVLEGVGAAELNGGPGHFPGSVLPGEGGNSVISAHRDRHFRRVGELAVGSRIRTQTRAGWTDWVVTERRIVSRDTPALFQEASATLTLTTCWPLRYFGPAPDRLIIIAKPA